MILADTSVWVEYDRATGSGGDQRLTELIAADGQLVVTEPPGMTPSGTLELVDGRRPKAPRISTRWKKVSERGFRRRAAAK